MATGRADSPLVSVDVVPLVVAGDGHLQFVTSRRLYAPYKGRFSLPGVLVVAGERLGEAAVRALVTKSGIDSATTRFLHLTQPYDNPARDARGPTVSVAYLAVVDPDGVAATTNRFVPIHEIEQTSLPFDHSLIASDALSWAATHLWDDGGALMQALLGDSFDTPAARSAYTDLHPGFDPTNLPRLLRSQPCLSETHRSAPPIGRGRPPVWWTFGREPLGGALPDRRTPPGGGRALG